MEEFGKKLRFYRKQRRMTQSELAGRVGVAPAYVSQIESSLRVPSLKVARRIAESLHIDLPVLLGGDGASPPADAMTDSQKLDLLRRLVRSVEFDHEYRPDRLDLETYCGARGVLISVGDRISVRMYSFPEKREKDEPVSFHFHPGTELVYCAAGRIHLLVEGRQRTIGEGEVLTFDASRAHAVWGEKGSVAVSTINPPLTPEEYREGPSNHVSRNSSFPEAEESSAIDAPRVV